MNGSDLFNKFHEQMKSLKTGNPGKTWFDCLGFKLMQANLITNTIKTVYQEVKSQMLIGPAEPCNSLQLNNKIYMVNESQHLLIKIKSNFDNGDISAKNFDINLYDLDTARQLHVERYPTQPDFWMSIKQMTAPECAQQVQRFETLLYNQNGFAPKLA